MTVAAGWLVELAANHVPALAVAGLAAVIFIALVMTGAAGRIALVVEEHTSDPTGM